MDRLWSPWRYQYVGKTDSPSTCIFCDKISQNRDAENYIVYRGGLNFVMLNLFPYSSGHVMIAPYRHVATLEDADERELAEMMRLTRASEARLRAIYRPQGLNIGMNIGQSAGAGVAGHIHMHVLPRWSGDANFMTTVAETRVLPEDIGTTFEKVARAFEKEP